MHTDGVCVSRVPIALMRNGADVVACIRSLKLIYHKSAIKNLVARFQLSPVTDTVLDDLPLAFFTVQLYAPTMSL